MPSMVYMHNRSSTKFDCKCPKQHVWNAVTLLEATTYSRSDIVLFYAY